eukprot:757218-Hanusia_phi.AAC.3
MIHQRILLLPPPGLLRAVGARRSLEGLDLCRLVASPLPLEVDAPQVVAVELSEALGDAELLLLPRESSQLDLAHGADTIHSPPPLLVQLQDRVVGHREVGRKCVDPHAARREEEERQRAEHPPCHALKARSPYTLPRPSPDRRTIFPPPPPDASTPSWPPAMCSTTLSCAPKLSKGTAGGSDEVSSARVGVQLPSSS